MFAEQAKKYSPVQAGGVAKDYLALCRALIDGLGWEVTLLTPVNIQESGEDDVAQLSFRVNLNTVTVGRCHLSRLVTIFICFC